MIRPKFSIGFMLLMAMGASLAALFAVLVMDYTRPERMTWEALSIPKSPVVGDLLVVKAKTTRLPSEGCTNGFQTDLRQSRGEITRLPVPTRTLSDDGEARYDIVLPSDIVPGIYEVRVRETYRDCGRADSIPSPWLSFEVLPNVE